MGEIDMRIIGEPGTGKVSMLKIYAEHMKIPVTEVVVDEGMEVEDLYSHIARHNQEPYTFLIFSEVDRAKCPVRSFLNRLERHQGNSVFLVENV